MPDNATLQKTIAVELSPQDLAKAFCEMNDDAQAKFFVEAAGIMQTWRACERAMQAYYIGAHLKNCSCSTYEAREFIDEIYGAMHSDSTHGADKHDE